MSVKSTNQYQRLADKMIEVADELGDIGYEGLAEQIRYAAETIEDMEDDE